MRCLHIIRLHSFAVLRFRSTAMGHPTTTVGELLVTSALCSLLNLLPTLSRCRRFP